MMAGWVVSGALLIVMLMGASYSYPVKQGFDPSYNYGVNPEVPSSGFAPEPPGSGAASKMISNPAPPQTASQRESSYPQPSVQRQPAAAPYSSGAAPAHSGYTSSSSAGMTPPSSFQPIKDIPWAVAPPSPLSGEETSTRPSARWFVSSEPEPLGPSNVSPPSPVLRAGELSQIEESYEHGNYKSETGERGFLPPPRDVKVSSGRESTGELQPSLPGRSWIPYPYPYDYMFLTGQYPPGTLTHSSLSFEQGTDHWQDTHYIRDYYPADPSTQQVEPVADFEAPQNIKQPSQPVKQSVGGSYRMAQ